MRNAKILFCFFCLFVCFFQISKIVRAQDGGAFVLNAEQFADGKTVALDKNAAWKFKAGDEAAWAAKDFDDAGWQTITETRLKPELLRASGWNGRAWLRLRVRVDENLIGRPLALLGSQNGASEIYLDNRRLVEFGEIGEDGSARWEYNPNSLPVPVRFDQAGEHTIAVRFASATFADLSVWKTRWLLNGGARPTFYLSLKDAGDWRVVVDTYANTTSMRGGFLFVGVLFSLAFLHFMLYVFYRVGRANLFYSLYAGSLGVFILCNNLSNNAHASGDKLTVLRLVSTAAFALAFTGLLAFFYVAFDRRLGKIFWAMTALWVLHTVLSIVFLGSVGVFSVLPYVLIGLTFTFSIFQIISAAVEKRPGAWILLAGVQSLAFAMTMNLLRQFYASALVNELNFIGEFALVLGVPVAVSIFLARNFARTNRDLAAQLERVERLSEEKIEQERQSAELRAENERRAKELEEARQLQLSMLPRKLPELPNLEIAVYMRPATEVGGDYYDFHVAEDGTLTVAVGDATGHGLKAGTMVSVTKGLFNNLAHAPEISETLNQMSRSLKMMNLRGLFMALTLLKFKNDNLLISAAGMPAALIYRAADAVIEEVGIRALPLGGISKFKYEQRGINLATGDCVVLMSDGFPEMFNPAGEMLGFGKAAEILPEVAGGSAQQIVNHLVQTGEAWADGRPADDDVTFVVVKMKSTGGPN